MVEERLFVISLSQLKTSYESKTSGVYCISCKLCSCRSPASISAKVAVPGSALLTCVLRRANQVSSLPF